MKHVVGWLLLLPAATLLVAFTHYPAAATLIERFFSTGTAVSPSLFGAVSDNWLGNPATVMGRHVASTIWKEAGFFMIFFLGALQALPPEFGEAARIEGASRWYFSRRVTFPLL